MTTARRRIASGSPYEPVIGFSRAVRVGDRVLISGTAPIWPDGSCDPDPEAQAARCLESILTAPSMSSAPASTWSTRPTGRPSAGPTGRCSPTFARPPPWWS